MKKIALLMGLFALTACQTSVEKETTSSIQDKYSASVVQVKYYLKNFEGEEPRISADYNASYLNGDPVATQTPLIQLGYLVSDTQVVTKNLKVDPKYIAYIEAVSIDSPALRSMADISAFELSNTATQLLLEKSIGGEPLQFVKGEPHIERSYSFLPVTKRLFFKEKLFGNGIYLFQNPNETFYICGEPSLILSRDGSPYSLTFASTNSLDSQKVQFYHEWKNWIDAKSFYGKLDETKNHLDSTLFAVRLNLKLTQEQMNSWDMQSEFQTYGITFKKENGESYLAIAHQLKPKHTATLTGITAIAPNGDEFKGEFVANLRNWGIMIAKFKNLPAKTQKWNTKFPMNEWSEFIGVKISSVNNRRLLSADYTNVDFEQFTYGETPCAYPRFREAQLVMNRQGEVLALSFPMNSPIYKTGYSSRNSLPLQASVITQMLDHYTQFENRCNVPTENKRPLPEPWMGIDLRPLDDTLAKIKGFESKSRSSNPIVADVYEGSPAQKAGIKVDDILVSWGTNPNQTLEISLGYRRDFEGDFPWDKLEQIPEMYYSRIPSPFPPTSNEFIEKLSELGPNNMIYITVFRAGEYLTFPLTLEEGKPSFETAQRIRSKNIGLTVKDMTYEVRKYLNLKETDPGVIICDLTMGGKSSVAGLKPFERITRINDKDIFNVEDFKKALSEATDEVRMVVNRIGKERIVKISKKAKVPPPVSMPTEME